MSPKNPQLMKIFKDLGFVEHMGTEIIRILSKYDESIFTFSSNFIKVSIPFNKEKNSSNSNETSTKNVSKRQLKIMELIKENLTQDEIADKLGVSRFTVIRDIKLLKQNGFLSRVGSNKTGFWKIN